MHKLSIKVDQLPGEIHSHGHFGVPEGVEMRFGQAYCRGKLVMFRHHLEA
jgi:hypothetical protein